MTVVPVSYPAVSALDAIDGGVPSGVNYPASRDQGIAALGGDVPGTGQVALAETTA